MRCPSVPNSGQGFSISKTRLEGAAIYLTDRPAKADWLTAEQKAWLSAKLAGEIAAKQAATHLTLGQALASPKVITLSLIYFGFVGALYGMQFWLPQIVKAFGFSNAQTGFVTAVPLARSSVRRISTGRPGQVSQRVRPLAGPMTGSRTRSGIHTPCPIVRALGRNPSFMAEVRGHGFRRAPERLGTIH